MKNIIDSSVDTSIGYYIHWSIIIAMQAKAVKRYDQLHLHANDHYFVSMAASTTLLS